MAGSFIHSHIHQLDPGPAGPQGVAGTPGSDGEDGVDGISAYQAAVNNGFVGSESDWIASLEGPEGEVGPQGPAGTISTTLNSTSRTLNNTFTPHATRPTLVMYTIEITAIASLTSGQAGTVELRSDANATPTTVRVSCKSDVSITLGISLGWNHVTRHVLCHVVQPGHTVRLVTSGSATMSIVHQIECTL